MAIITSYSAAESETLHDGLDCFYYMIDHREWGLSSDPLDPVPVSPKESCTLPLPLPAVSKQLSNRRKSVRQKTGELLAVLDSLLHRPACNSRKTNDLKICTIFGFASDVPRAHTHTHGHRTQNTIFFNQNDINISKGRQSAASEPPRLG
jgi:hypothetical protein